MFECFCGHTLKSFNDDFRCENKNCLEFEIVKTIKDLIQDGTIDYKKEVMRTVGNLTTDELFLNATLGIAGESGEIVDIVKKFLFQKKDAKQSFGNLVLELGDLLWYITLMLNLLDLDIDYIIAANVEKLRERYPNGFNV